MEECNQEKIIATKVYSLWLSKHVRNNKRHHHSCYICGGKRYRKVENRSKRTMNRSTLRSNSFEDK